MIRRRTAVPPILRLLALTAFVFLPLSVAPAAASEPIAERMPPPRNVSGLCADLEQGRVNFAGIALRNGAKLDGPDPEDPLHRPPLICAAEAGQAVSVAFLLSKGAKADVTRKGLTGPTTPLGAASMNGHGDVVKLLLEAGASVNKVSGGWTPLMAAAFESEKPNSEGYAAAMQALLAAGADPNVASERGETALTLAIGNRNTAGVVLLASRGANPDTRDGNGRSPLSLAAALADDAMVEALLKAGAKADAADPDGKTAWVYALEKADRAIMERLEKAGARPRYDAADLDAAIGNAVCSADLPLAKKLLGGNGADLAKGKRFGRAIVRAAGCARVDSVRFLLENGADPNVAGERGETPLMAALTDYSSTGREAALRTELASLLIGRGADVEARNELGETPLHHAVTWDNPEAVRLLLSKKADPNRADGKGNLPLVAAVKKGEAAMAKALLDGSADPNAKDPGGKTAWSHAAERGDEAMTALLEKAGARPDFESLTWAGNESGIEALRQTAVTTDAAWTALWKEAFGKAAPPMDFSRYFVACAFLGHDAGGAFSIGFHEPVVEGKTLRVDCTIAMRPLSFGRPSGRGASDRAGQGGQYAMKVFPKREGLEIVVRGRSPEQDIPGLDAIPPGRSPWNGVNP
jgi:ankyrin repeat protein